MQFSVGKVCQQYYFPGFFLLLLFYEEACNFVSIDVSEASGGGVPTVCIFIYEERKWYNKSCWTDSHKISI